MTRLLIALVLLTSAPATAQNDIAAPAIHYTVSWDDASTHYYHVSMTVGELVGETVEVRMPAWRPGRYVMQNYARYVVDFEARSPDGEMLPFEKVDKDTWRVITQGNNEVEVSYRNYANVLDAGESYLDETEAYLNPISVLMNVPRRMTEPVSLTIKQPDGWQTVTPLDVHEETQSFVAADYHELVDSPFLVSPDVEMLQFDAHGTTFDIAVQGTWEYDRDMLIAHHRAIVDAQVAIMGVVPFDRYLFMYHIMPEQSGHGVEHKNSTSIVLGPSAAMTMPTEGEYAGGMYRAFLGVASHEFFHAWNVERIRPAALVPTDYSTEQYTTQMWIFEGITDYYADVALHRAGLTTEEGFLGGLAGAVGSFDESPGRKVTSIAMSSFDSWSKQNDAPPGTFYSFYTAGKAMGLVLDMEVRGRTGGSKTLDDVFRYLYYQYPMHERGVPERGFQSALETVTDTSFDTFFTDHIYGTEDVDWQASLSRGGLRLETRPDANPASWMRVYMGGMTILASHPSGRAVAAGLADGDTFTRVGNVAVADQASFEGAFATYDPGDVVEVTVMRDDQEVSLEIEVGVAPIIRVLEPDETAAGVEVAIRDAWLSASH